MTDESDRTWIVYALSDPRNNEIRYIGVTHRDLHERLAKHIHGARHQKQFRSHVLNWVALLLRDGVMPVISVVEEGVGLGWEAEQRWIAFYKDKGADLTNISNGGCGPLGCVRSPETRQKLALANLGKKQSPELVEKRIAPLRGLKHTQQSRANMSAGAAGRVVSDEGKARIQLARQENPDWNKKIADSNRGLKRSDETRKKVSQAHIGIGHTEDECLKISIGNKKAWQDPVMRERRLQAIRDANKKAWQDPEKRERRIAAMKEGQQRKRKVL